MNSEHHLRDMPGTLAARNRDYVGRIYATKRVEIIETYYDEYDGVFRYRGTGEYHMVPCNPSDLWGK